MVDYILQAISHMMDLSIEARVSPNRIIYYSRKRLNSWNEIELKNLKNQLDDLLVNYYNPAAQVKSRMPQETWDQLAALGENNLYEHKQLRLRLKNLREAWGKIYKRKKGKDEKSKHDIDQKSSK